MVLFVNLNAARTRRRLLKLIEKQENGWGGLQLKVGHKSWQQVAPP
jgi:hypothetical protein